MTKLKYLSFFLITFLNFVCILKIEAQTLQFRGPNRNGIFPAKGLLKQWPENGPETLWVAENLGKSNASTIATENRIYTTGNIDSLEYVSCLDLEGNILWQKPYGKTWKNSYPEARCTPTLEENRLYLLATR
jgi:hypothetical protein